MFKKLHYILAQHLNKNYKDFKKINLNKESQDDFEPSFN